MMYETHIQNGEDEIKIKVYFDYQPYEPMTRHYPGCSESVDIGEVRVADGGEICLLDEGLMEEEILEYREGLL
jgi:hypothetical protein